MSLAEEMRRIQNISLNKPKPDLCERAIQYNYTDLVEHLRDIAQKGKSSFASPFGERVHTGCYKENGDTINYGPLFTEEVKPGFINYYVTVKLTDLGKRFFSGLKTKLEHDGFRIAISPCFFESCVGPKQKFNFNEKVKKNLELCVHIAILVEISF